MGDSLGVIGVKVGMTRIFDSDNRMTPVTVVEAGPCSVVQVKTPERDGYSAVQLSFGSRKQKNVRNPQRGHYKKAGVGTGRWLREFRVEKTDDFEVGSTISVSDVFESGQLVDVIGTSKGRGFAGVMKRHNFSGQGASHGNEKKHRMPGSIGNAADPSRVFPGKRMPGHLGNARTTVRNLSVVKVDPERNLLVIKGSIPGPNGGMVMVRPNSFKAPKNTK